MNLDPGFCLEITIPPTPEIASIRIQTVMRRMIAKKRTAERRSARAARAAASAIAEAAVGRFVTYAVDDDDTFTAPCGWCSRRNPCARKH